MEEEKEAIRCMKSVERNGQPELVAATVESD